MSLNQLWIHGLHRIAGSGSTIDKELWEPQNDVSKLVIQSFTLLF